LHCPYNQQRGAYTHHRNSAHLYPSDLSDRNPFNIFERAVASVESCRCIMRINSTRISVDKAASQKHPFSITFFYFVFTYLRSS